MTSLIALLLLAAPLTQALVGALPAIAGSRGGRAAARRQFTLTHAASWAAAAAALGLVGALALHGRTTTALFDGSLAALGLRLDALSAIMLALVAFMGLVVVRFSRNYLDGDPHQDAFFRGLSRTLASVSLLVSAGTLPVLLAAWIATSLSLHDLLVFRRERPEARRPALKKFAVARMSDVTLLVACVALALGFGTVDIAAIAEAARLGVPGDAEPALLIAAIALAFAGLMKSVQAPFHGWLTEVMETPTPVSALLHAGVVNAGGFLLIRFSDVFASSVVAMDLVLVIGATTAVFASLALIAQPSVKVGLAWSTIAQMGLMMMQCGLGLFSAALVHILAHSAYKAYAFLSAGGAVEAIRGERRAAADRTLSRKDRVLSRTAALGAVLATAGLAALLGANAVEKPAFLFFAPLLALGFAQMVQAGWAFGARLGDALVLALTASGLTAAYILVQDGAAMALGGTVAATPALGALEIAFLVLTLAAFSGIILLQSPRRTPARYEALRVAAKNGFYLDAAFDRLFAGRAPRVRAAR